MNPRAVLEVRGLAAGYGDLEVLRGVDLTAWEGHLTAVLGSNGAGKTTLLSTITGLLRARAGSVTLLGNNVTRTPAHLRSTRGLALVQEGKRVFHDLTVQQNLSLGGYRMSRTERRQAAALAYERFPILKAKRNDRAGSMSGGQQQMLAIAQALMPSPKVLMLDEPSAGLAPIVVSELLEAIKVLKADGVGIILVEQLVGEALSVADHVVVLQQGQVVIDQTADSVDERDLMDAYLGDSR